jgi:hypothetical protein
MRILLTELGNNSPGDEAICIAAARRLTAWGASVTCLYRVSMEESFERAGIHARHIAAPLTFPGPDISSTDALLQRAWAGYPDEMAVIEKTIRDTDVLCIAPGGKFTDGLRNHIKLIAAAVAKTLNIPYLVLHQSVGPISSPQECALIREVFASAHLIVTRDFLSTRFLKSLGVPRHLVFEARDAAFAEIYPSPPEPHFALGVNLRFSKNGHSTVSALETFLSLYRKEEANAPVLVFSTTTAIPPDVFDLARKLDFTVLPSFIKYPHYLQTIGRCRINVSDSYHGIIFSVKSDRHVIPLQPGLKTWKLAGMHEVEGTPFQIHQGINSPETALEVLDAVMQISERPDVAKRTLSHQREVLSFCREAAEHGWEEVSDVLNKIA